MTSSIIKLNNNVFSLEFLTKKEYIEMLKNFIKTCDVLNYVCNNDSVSDSLMDVFKKIGIIQDKINLSEIKKIISYDEYNLLIRIGNFFKDKQIEKFSEIKNYCLEYRNRQAKLEDDSDKLTLIDLFCGAGGLSLGFSQKNFKIICANDIEKSAVRTYSFNHPETEASKILLGDIAEVCSNIKEYIENNSIDVLVGGPPCQGFSMANRQRLIDDPRNVLYKYYVDIVNEVNPKIFIMENVKGMLKVADQVIEDFNSEKQNYDISYKVFNMSDFGVPQRRERLIYIGVRKDISEFIISSYEIINLISDSKKLNFNLEDALYNLRTLEASRIKNSTELDSEISGSKIDKIDYKSNEYIKLINMDKSLNLVYNHKARYNNDRDIEIYSRMLPGDDSSSSRIEDIMPYKNRNHIFKDKYYKLKPNEPSKTITAHMKFDCNMYIHPFEARGLTPREAARIQSYPDDYFFLGPYTKTYMQIGNSVPPLFGRELARIIKKYLKGV